MKKFLILALISIQSYAIYIPKCAFTEADIENQKKDCQELKKSAGKDKTKIKEFHKFCKNEIKLIKKGIHWCEKIEKTAQELSEAKEENDQKKIAKKCKKLTNQFLKSMVVYENSTEKVIGTSRKERLERVKAVKERLEKGKDKYETSCKDAD